MWSSGEYICIKARYCTIDLVGLTVSTIRPIVLRLDDCWDIVMASQAARWPSTAIAHSLDTYLGRQHLNISDPLSGLT
ncbi:hypothetical protein HD806DRAFT_509009 [Xylariaceae sp. AK1471]|nr:hypothetical protein HD806DRAFT_509009 [Xylariaceae sp. AK1471]